MSTSSGEWSWAAYIESSPAEGPFVSTHDLAARALDHDGLRSAALRLLTRAGAGRLNRHVGSGKRCLDVTRSVAREIVRDARAFGRAVARELAVPPIHPHDARVLAVVVIILNASEPKATPTNVIPLAARRARRKR